MANKPTPKEESKKDIQVPEPAPLPPRIHINEFLVRCNNLDAIQKSAFKLTSKKEWMRITEWEEQLKGYLGN